MTRRCFFGIYLDDAARTQAFAAQAIVRAAAPELRFVMPHNLHLTTRFLGATSDAQFDALCRFVDARSPSWRASVIEARRIEAWATVVVSVLDASAPLRAIAIELEQAARDEGFAPEQRPFKAHVTLARGRKRGLILGDSPLAVRCDHVALIESLGGDYLERRRWPLAA